MMRNQSLYVIRQWRLLFLSIADSMFRWFFSLFLSLLLYLYSYYNITRVYHIYNIHMGNRYSNPYDPYWYDYDPMYGGMGGYYDYDLSAVSVFASG